MPTTVLEHRQIAQKIVRIAYEILENLNSEETIHIIGVAGNGVVLAEFITEEMKKISTQNFILNIIHLDKENPLSKPITLDSNLDLSNKTLVLVDDVINSGKTTQYALNHLLQFPVYQVKIVTLVDRKHRRFPVHADFVGLQLSTTLLERVEVSFEQEWKAYLV